MPTASAPRAEHGLRARVNMTGQCSAKEKNLSPAVTIRAIGARTGRSEVRESTRCKLRRRHLAGRRDPSRRPPIGDLLRIRVPLYQWFGLTLRRPPSRRRLRRLLRTGGPSGRVHAEGNDVFSSLLVEFRRSAASVGRWIAGSSRRKRAFSCLWLTRRSTYRPCSANCASSQGPRA
jgi:hypothetical protein